MGVGHTLRVPARGRWTRFDSWGWEFFSFAYHAQYRTARADIDGITPLITTQITWRGVMVHQRLTHSIWSARKGALDQVQFLGLGMLLCCPPTFLFAFLVLYYICIGDRVKCLILRELQE